MNLKEMQTEIHKTAKEKGWWEKNRDFPEVIALIHSELSEALEDHRHHRPSYFIKDGKPEGYGIELADCIIRILDYAEAYGLDMEQLIKLKMEFNKTRSYRHGGLRI